MKILIICGAGASSTFVAHRIRRTAAERDLEVEVTAGTASSLPGALTGIDVLLIGPHLPELYDDIREAARALGVGVVLLPDTIFAARDGEEALELARAAAGARL
jgi:PTS system cellobiose-specific IIB component